MDDPNLKYVSKFLNRPYGPRTVEPTTAADKTVADKGVAVGDNWPLNLSEATPLAPLALSLPSEGEENSYSDTQIQNIYESGDSDTKNFITKLIDDGTKVINNNKQLVDILKTGTQWQVEKTVGNTIAKELGFASAGAAGGPAGMAIGWLVGKLFDFFMGEPDKEKVPGKYGFNYLTEGSKEEKEKDYFKTKEYLGSDEADRVREEEEDAKKAEEEKKISSARLSGSFYVPTPKYEPSNEGGGSGGPTGPTSQSESDYGYGSDAGWWAKGGRVKLTKGGRVDKALTGRSRDI